MTAGFGIERLGLLSLRFPWPVLIVLLLASQILLCGASRLGFSSDIREIFQSKSAAFDTLDKIDAQFPSGDHEVQAVAESGHLFNAESLRALRNLNDRLKEVQGVSDVVSIFSATHPPARSGAARPLIPQNLARVRDMEALQRSVAEHPLVAGRLLSQDAGLAVFAIDLEGNNRGTEENGEIVSRIRDATDEALKDSGIEARLTGTAVMRVEIIGALMRDQKILRFGALVIGFLVSWAVFRKFRYVLIASAPAAAAVIWLLGLMYFAGFEVNVLTNMIPTLVVVIAFSDSVHLLFDIRDSLERKVELREAVRRAVRDVGPACVLTSLTTALALASLTLVEHQFIVRFGMIAAIGAVLALAANLLILPALAVLGLNAPPAKSKWDLLRAGAELLSRGAAWTATAAPRTVALLGLALAIGAGWAHSLNEPTYRYVDNLPRGNPALRAVTAVDNKLAGANTLKVHIDWPEKHDLKSEETLNVVRQVHNTVNGTSPFRAVSSLSGIADWLGEGQAGRVRLARLMAQTRSNGDSPLLGSVASTGDTAALVTARMQNMTAAELVPSLDRLESRLAEIERQHPDADITVSGIVPISAEASYEMIQQLNYSLLGAIGVIILLIALALLSPVGGLVSILPNVLPVVAGGLYLHLTGKGLDFTSLVAFTVGFGLAVDSTIHMLNRYRLERGRASSLDTDIRRTVTTVGPVVAVSTVVITAGMAIALVSKLPKVQLFGEVSVVVLVTALLADLFVLPAVLATVERWRGRR